MPRGSGARLASAAWLLSLLAGCASQPTAFTPALAEPDRQYICQASFVLGEPTRRFNLRTHYRDETYLIQLGEPLQQQVATRFWSDAVAAHSGRPLPVVAIGFDARTATRPGDPESDTLQVGLQYQIFKPTGQSRLGIVGGQSQAMPATAAATEALSRALQQLEGVLEQTGLCRRASP